MTELPENYVPVRGNMPNYATLRFMNAETGHILVQMSFRVCDDGYGGCCVEFQQSLVDAELQRALAKNGLQGLLLRTIRQGYQAYGDRGSHPAGFFGKAIRDSFVRNIDHFIIERIGKNLPHVLEQDIEVTLETIGFHPLQQRLKYSYQPAVIENIG